MIGIQLEGDAEFLETMPDTSIEMTLENPLLGDDEDHLSPGSFSLPFNIPGGEVSPGNARKLKNPDVIENNAAYQIQKANLLVSGVPFKKGNLRGKSSANDIISTHFTFGLNTLSPALKTTRLRDLFNTNIVISSSLINKEIFIKRLNANNTGVTINGILHTANSTSGLGAVINTYYSANMVVDGNFWLPFSDLISAGNTPLGMVPSYIRVRMARQQTITGISTLVYATDPHIELNIKIDAAVRADFSVEIGDLTTYYAPFKTFADARVKFPVMFNAALHEADVKKENEIVNGVDASGLVVNNPNYGYYTIRNLNSFQPFVHLKHVLDTIALAFNFEYEGDFYTENDLPNMLIDNSVALDLPMDLIGDTKFIFWRRSFYLNELLPDISIVDFFKALKSRYNLGVYVNETSNKVRIKKREIIALSIDYEDITSMASPIEGDEDIRVTGIKLFQPKEDNDAFSTDETLNVGITTEKTYEIKCGRLFSTKSAVFFSGLVEGPYTSRKNAEKFGFRVFHYKGLILNSAYYYPGAAISGVVINETLNGLYTRYWQYWLLFEKNRRLVNLKVEYPFRLIRFFDFEMKRRFNRVSYLVKSIRFKITNQKVTVSEVELYTLK